MNKETGKKPSNFVAYPVSSDIVILNGEGICVASSNPKKIGTQIRISKSNVQTKTNLKIGQLFFDLVYQKDQYQPNELSLIKKLAQITLEQYINSISQPSFGSIDQFLASFLNLPANSGNFAEFEEESQSLGLNLEANRSAIIVEIENFTKDNLTTAVPDYPAEEIIKTWKNKIISAITGFFTIKTDIIAVYLGNDRFVFFKEIIGDQEKFIKNMKTAYRSIFEPLIDPRKDNLTVAFSAPHAGIKGLYESYHEALLALNHGRKLSKNKNQSFYYEDLGAIRILSEESVEKKKNLAREVLKPLDKETLRVTLEIFFNEDMDIKKTAAKMRVHPNTVNYRLDKIAENLNLDPKVFKQAFELRIALLTDQIFT